MQNQLVYYTQKPEIVFVKVSKKVKREGVSKYLKLLKA